MQICSLVWSLYIWQVKTILPVGPVDGENVDGTDASVETDKGVEADSVASRFGVGVDALAGKLQARIRNISPQINRIRLFIIFHLNLKVASVGL
jgi:hypothetical protein